MLTRRSALTLTAGAAALAVLGAGRTASAAAEDAEKLIAEFTGGATPSSGALTLTAPEIAENGNTVPINVSVDSPMTEADHVTEVMILAEGNPTPFVATMAFTAMSGVAAASTRIRLAKTQNVVAVAKTSAGAYFIDRKEVKVTIGGCGG